MTRIEYQILENQLAIMEYLKYDNDIVRDKLSANIMQTQSLIDDKLNENESYGEAPKIELGERF